MRSDYVVRCPYCMASVKNPCRTYRGDVTKTHTTRLKAMLDKTKKKDTSK